MKLKIIKFKSVKSTNDKAIKLIQKYRYTKGLIFSETQTKGKGLNFVISRTDRDLKYDQGISNYYFKIKVIKQI